MDAHGEQIFAVLENKQKYYTLKTKFRTVVE